MNSLFSKTCVEINDQFMNIDLQLRLRAEIAGDVRDDRFTRGRYATDASIRC